MVSFVWHSLALIRVVTGGVVAEEEFAIEELDANHGEDEKK